MELENIVANTVLLKAREGEAVGCRESGRAASELGGGVVPVDPREREARERAGRLACLLAARADTVIRVFCGIPKVLKGEGK